MRILSRGLFRRATATSPPSSSGVAFHPRAARGCRSAPPRRPLRPQPLIPGFMGNAGELVALVRLKPRAPACKPHVRFICASRKTSSPSSRITSRAFFSAAAHASSTIGIVRRPFDPPQFHCRTAPKGVRSSRINPNEPACSEASSLAGLRSAGGFGRGRTTPPVQARGGNRRGRSHKRRIYGYCFSGLESGDRQG